MLSSLLRRKTLTREEDPPNYGINLYSDDVNDVRSWVEKIERAYNLEEEEEEEEEEKQMHDDAADDIQSLGQEALNKMMAMQDIEGMITEKQRDFYCKTYTAAAPSVIVQAIGSTGGKIRQGTTTLKTSFATGPLPRGSSRNNDRHINQSTGQKSSSNPQRPMKPFGRPSSQNLHVIGGGASTHHMKVKQQMGPSCSFSISQHLPPRPPATNQENCAAVANHHHHQSFDGNSKPSEAPEDPSVLSSSSSSHHHHHEQEDIVRRVIRLIRKTFEEWRSLAHQTANAKLELAIMHAARQQAYEALKGWKAIVTQSSAKAKHATQHNQRIMLKKITRAWKSEVKGRKALLHQAQIVADFKTTAKAFSALYSHAMTLRHLRDEQELTEQLREARQLWEKAVTHHHWSLTSRLFTLWSTGTQKAREQRRLVLLHQERRQRITGLMIGLTAQHQQHQQQQSHQQDEHPVAVVEAIDEQGNGGLQHQEPLVDESPNQSASALRPPPPPSATCSPSTNQQQTTSRLTNKAFRERQEARARQREERRLMLKEKQIAAEAAEKEAQSQQERVQKERKKIEKRDEMLRRQRLEEERTRELDRMRQLLTLSRLHYQRSNLLYRGMLPWRRVHEADRLKLKKAEAFHRDMSMTKLWSAWQQAVQQGRFERRERLMMQTKRAVGRYRQCLSRRCFEGMKRGYTINLAKKKAVALRTRAIQLKDWVGRWTEAVEEEKVVTQARIDAAAIVGARLDKRFVLQKWQCSLQIEREMKEIEARKAKTWMKVKAWMNTEEDDDAVGNMVWRERWDIK